MGRITFLIASCVVGANVCLAAYKPMWKIRERTSMETVPARRLEADAEILAWVMLTFFDINVGHAKNASCDAS